MGENTTISWTDHSHNFWYGCRKVSAGCKNCYAERDMNRYPQFNFDTVTRAKGFDKPLRWKEPAKVFVNSWSDFFIEEADPWRDDAWDIIRRTPHLTYQILTKRPALIADRLPADWGGAYNHVWLGMTAETQQAYNDRIIPFIKLQCTTRFISFEPLLEEISPNLNFTRMINWFIIGGESGPNSRPMKLEWAEKLVDMLPERKLFFKQVGGNRRIEGVFGGDKLNGKTYKNFPRRFNPVSEYTELVQKELF